VTSITRNPAMARDVVVPWNPFTPIEIQPSDQFAMRVSTRIGTDAADKKCAGPGGSHVNATGLRLYYDAAARNSRVAATVSPNSSADWYLHSNGKACANTESTGVTTRFLDTAAPGSAAAKCKDSPGIAFAGGNQFKTIGTWNVSPPG
jgi:hypothetical protein